MSVPFVPKYVRPTIIVFDGEKRILLVQYRENGAWGLPGGAMEVGETAEQAAQRELLEETGLTATALKLEAVVNHKDVLNIVYVAQGYTGEPRSDGLETNDVRFFSLTDLPPDLDPYIRKALSQAASRQIGHP